MKKSVIKWILAGDEIRISHAAYHRWLLKDNETTCDGGGVVDVDEETKRVIFSGFSDDFGKADRVKFMNAAVKDRASIDNALYFMFDVETEDYEIIFE